VLTFFHIESGLLQCNIAVAAGTSRQGDGAARNALREREEF